MTGDLHNRAKALMASARVEGISATDREWLHAHLESCAGCAEQANATERAIRSLRAVSVRVDPELVNRTRRTVHLRASELNGRKPMMAGLWILSVLSWACIVASAPYLWRGFAWAGHWIGIPDLLWQTGFALWWAMPVVLVVAILTKNKVYSAD